MASIVQGYEYDIFISYRQKDNQPTPSYGLRPTKTAGKAKVTGGFSEFVDEALKKDAANNKQEQNLTK